MRNSGVALMRAAMYVSVPFLLLSASSCSTKKVALQDIVRDSAASVKKDSVSSTVYKTEYRDRYIDRYVSNTYVVSPSGDTTKTMVYERVSDTSNTMLMDSVTILRSRIDSLTHLRDRDKAVTVEKGLSAFQRIKVCSFWYLVAALSLLLIILYVKIRY